MDYTYMRYVALWAATEGDDAPDVGDHQPPGPDSAEEDALLRQAAVDSRMIDQKWPDGSPLVIGKN